MGGGQLLAGARKDAAERAAESRAERLEEERRVRHELGLTQTQAFRQVREPPPP